MDFNSLTVFLSLAATLHFGRASRECNLSPSALSRTILRLEEELGQRLFVRDNRSVELTPAGLRFRSYALEALDGWKKLKNSLASGQEELTGEIVLYSSVAASYTVLSALLPIFRVKHPAIHIRLETGDPANAIERVQSGAADITVAARPDSLARSLVFKAVTVTPLEFIAPAIRCEAQALTSKPPIPWGRVPMVLSEAGLSRKRADAWFRASRIRPNVYAEVSGHEAIVSMVRLGCGVGVVPRIVVERFSQKGEVRMLDVAPPLEPYTIGLCAHRRRLASPVVKAFWDIVA
jgi:LysR family positive regulator for ilvC